MDDYLACGPLIIERLRVMVPEFATVSGWADYASVSESAMPTPAAYVVYDGDVQGDSAGQGSAQRVTQRWGVVIAVRNVSKAIPRDGIRKEAGPLMMAVLKALSGWQPDPEFRPLKRLEAPKPIYSGLIGYFPLMFAAGIVTNGG